MGLADAHGSHFHSHQTSDPGADGRSLQQWRSIKEKYWLELQKVQHSIQCRDPGRKPRACSPTAMLKQMKERIRNIFQDMHILSGILPDTSVEVRGEKEAQSSAEEGEACRRGLQRHYRGDVLLD